MMAWVAFKSVKTTLMRIAHQGGMDTEKDRMVNPGAILEILSRNTYAYPCPACGGGYLKKEAYLGEVFITAYLPAY